MYSNDKRRLSVGRFDTSTTKAFVSYKQNSFVADEVLCGRNVLQLTSFVIAARELLIIRTSKQVLLLQ